MKPTDLRVALFSGNYNYVRDGANQALNILVRHLLAQGASVRVYSPTLPNPAFPPAGDLVDVPAVPMPGGRGEYKLAVGLPRKVRGDLEAFAPNLVHLSAPDILGHRALTWARRHGIRSIASVHTRFETYPRYYNIGFVEPWLIAIMRRFYRRVDQVLVPSDGMAELLREWGVATPMATWSRGVNHQRFSPERRSEELRRSLGIAPDDVAVGFLGRLVLEKGLDVFAHVVTELQRRGVPHKVLVIGEGPAREWFSRQVPGAAFAGFRSGDELGRAVAAMDIFFNPSVTETFGNVTLEAMAAGVPVVAARATGSVGLVREGVTGRLVAPGDIAGYADAIQAMIADNTARRAMGTAGHADAAAYRWDLINEAVLRTYLEVMGRPPSA